MLLELGPLAGHADQLGAGRAVHDHHLVGGDQARQPLVAGLAVQTHLVARVRRHRAQMIWRGASGGVPRGHVRVHSVSSVPVGAARDRHSLPLTPAALPLSLRRISLDFREGPKARPFSRRDRVSQCVPLDRTGNSGARGRVAGGAQLYVLPCVGNRRISRDVRRTSTWSCGARVRCSATRDGRPVAINFGSAAAELAVCVRTVGLVDRSELSKLALEAPPAQLSALMRRMAGATVSAGRRAVTAAKRMWCGDDRQPGDRRSATRDTADASPGAAASGRGAPRSAFATLSSRARRDRAARAQHRPGASALGRSARRATLARPAVLARVSRAGIAAWWLLQSDRRALALVTAKPRARRGWPSSAPGGRTESAASGRRRPSATRSGAPAARHAPRSSESFRQPRRACRSRLTPPCGPAHAGRVVGARA